MMDVLYPVPLLLTAETFMQKYGPEETYDILTYILSHDGVWKTTAEEIAEYYMDNYYDTVVAYLEERRQDLNPAPHG